MASFPWLPSPVARMGSDFNANLGSIKHAIEFRDISDIYDDDIDAGALLMPRIMPPRLT